MKLTKIIIALAMLLVVQSANIFAQRPETTPKASPTTSTGCVSGNCVNGFGKFVYSFGDTYEGDFVDGKREGRGTYTILLFGYYTGEFKNGERNGKGKLVYLNDFTDEFTYEGDFVNGNYEGQGTYTLEDGSYYIGEFKNDRKNGNGKEFDEAKKLVREGTWNEGFFVGATTANDKSAGMSLDELDSMLASIKKKRIEGKCISGNCVNGKGKMVNGFGDIYEGSFVNGKRQGQGTYTYKSGTVYIGQFANNEENGYGTSVSKSETYEGNWVNGQKQGMGKRTFHNSGSTYEGDFVKDKFEGQGTYKNKDGSYYVGRFKDGSRNGYGKEFDKAKKLVREGTWKDGVVVGSATTAVSPTPKPSTPTVSTGCVSGNCINGNGTYKSSYATYIGDFVNGKFEGQGTYTFKSGEVFTGQFVKGQQNGKGNAKFPNGDSYGGNYLDDDPSGQGTYTYKNGDYYAGEWKHGKKHGAGKFYDKAKNTTQEGKWEDDFIIGTNAVANETIKLLRETLNGRFDLMNNNPLEYVLTIKKTDETLRYRIEFINDGGKLAFKWKETTKNEQSEKMVITDTALIAGISYLNFFTKNSGVLPDAVTTFVLSRFQYDGLKSMKEIRLKLGTVGEDLIFDKELFLAMKNYASNAKLLAFQTANGQTKMQVLDNRICPLIVRIETAEYTLELQ